MKDLLTIAQTSAPFIRRTLELAMAVKQHPERYGRALDRRTLIMIFEKPSLRTRVSFETGMAQLGGHAIYYDLSSSPLAAGKESIGDTARTLSRYVDAILARVFEHRTVADLARFATVPVINGLSNDAHPTQVLADMQTIIEHKGRLQGLKLAYLGDSLNNVTHSLMEIGAKLGVHVSVGCPNSPEFRPSPRVIQRALKAGARTGARITVTHDPVEAVRDAEVVYTDSWMSYHIPREQEEARFRILKPFQVNTRLMRKAAKGAIFMNCLPAVRGMEQTAEVIDGPRSVVFDQAENRLHMHKAILLMLLGAGQPACD